MVVKRVNITVDPVLLDEFYRYAAKKGIKFSTWFNVKLQESIEEEKMIEEYRQTKRSELMGAFYLLSTQKRDPPVAIDGESH